MLNDSVWNVIKEHLSKDGLPCDDKTRHLVEQQAEITPFNGGVFLAVGNEFDLFVVPEKRGKWRIRSEINNFLAKMAEKYDTTIIRIKEENQPSLRLAKHFGFQEVSRDDGLIRLERKLWVAQSEH